MEIVTIVIACILIVVAAMLGYSYGTHRKTKDPIGTLRIDTSDPDGPYIFLELSAGVGDVMQQKEVVLAVSTRNYSSQE